MDNNWRNQHKSDEQGRFSFNKFGKRSNSKTRHNTNGRFRGDQHSSSTPDEQGDSPFNKCGKPSNSKTRQNTNWRFGEEHHSSSTPDEAKNTRGNKNESRPRNRQDEGTRSRKEYPSTSKTVNQSDFGNEVPNLTSIDAISKVFEEKPVKKKIENQRRPKRPFRLGFRQLEEILKDEPDQLMLKLLNAQSGFAELVNNTKLTPDCIVLTLHALSKMGECSFTSNKIKLLELACTDVFVLTLTNFVIYLPLQDAEDKRRSSYFWNNPDNFFFNLNNYSKMIMSLQPSIACDILPKVIKSALSAIMQLTALSEKTKLMFETIQADLIMHKEEMAQRNKKPEKLNSEDLEPPNNFRDISLYPLPTEITIRNKVFVRPNIVEGAYTSVEHYLDIQFRLLREDFVKPLREGICNYMENGTNKANNIKIYKNVKFVSPQIVNSACGTLIQLEIKDGKMFKKKMENSRRFMFGSLMCFTKDNFKTIIFGKIIDRKLELLQKGQMVIEFEPGEENIKLNIAYLMIESTVYFEPYYHVLKALRDLNDENFPMKKYIIEIDTSSELPHYRNATNTNDERDYFIRNLLNDAQYRAYTSAMNESFAIIQGPPGTGKTFLGLEIAKSVIRKSEDWYNRRHPMLVVCFTNHALDQFLEGLLPVTTQIVRIGGQCKNKALQEHNIRNIRRRSSVAMHNAMDDIKAVQNDLKRHYVQLNAVTDFKGIIDIRCQLRSLPELVGTWFGKIGVKDFKDWLCGGLTYDMMRSILREKYTPKDDHENDNQESASDMFGNIFIDPNEEKYLHLDDNLFDDLSLFDDLPSSVYIVSLDDLEQYIQNLQRNKNILQASLEQNYIEVYKIDNEIQFVENTMEYVKIRMEEGKVMTEHEMFENFNYSQPHNIHPNERWNLYFYWLNRYKTNLIMQIAECETKYQKYYRAYEEIREIEDIEVMRNNLVIGMTTTGAARLQGSLRALKSPIVIVEEAAEIMESHVITSLTEHCQHLILIGDHQQLRPSTADFLMEKKYLLGISLFERMIRNNVHCNMLDVQHRMRPEIVNLIVPSIYPNLKNHDSVRHFPPVRGVNSNLYFITHKNPEEVCTDSSKSNIHEAKYLLQLAKYLVLNGYNPEDITILAAYSGQMFVMFAERKKIDLLKDIRISVLDNYQGEESKIILLSLVRNNSDGKIGFLYLKNRVCVALSRAREGLYIMGNIDILCANSSIWPKIRTELETLSSLGTSLSLRCQMHQYKITNVANPNDFCKVSEGGCDLICDKLLLCGHKCLMQCHILNRDHASYKCGERCTKRLCENGHICPKRCFEDCGNCLVPMLQKLQCGHESEFPCYQREFVCMRPVKATLPCSHSVDNKPCHADIEKYRCPFPCDTRLDTCGHSCEKHCHIRDDPDHLKYECYKPCTKYRKNCSTKHVCPNPCFQECPICDIVIKKERSCLHVHHIACSNDVELLQCKRPCKKKMPCGHPCKRNCNETCGGCKEKVKKIVPECQHEITIECSKEPALSYCHKNCRRILPCGHQCKKKCKDVCTTQCMTLLENPVPLPCGHSEKIPCHMNNREFMVENLTMILKCCRSKCSTKLECGHNCSGSCGDCYQGRIHKICDERCGVPLVCGHECQFPCRQACQPCTLPCMYRCSHSKCKKKCGDICTPCRQNCSRQCEHVRCTAWCNEKCTVPPCTKPCPKKLVSCNHPCIGFCGEPCPPLCKICNRYELVEEFCLGYEEEDDARFVLLEECGHIIESIGMEMWLQVDNEQIKAKQCPRCKTTLVRTKRYSNSILDAIEQTKIVKTKFYGEEQENILRRNNLHAQIMNIDKDNSLKLALPAIYRKVFSCIEEKLKLVHNKRRQPMSKILGQILNSKIQIFENICKLYNVSSKQKPKKILNYIESLLQRLIKEEYRMTEQEIKDYTVEIRRLQRMLQLSDLELTCPAIVEKDLYKSLANVLYSYQKYNIKADEDIKGDLEKLHRIMGHTLCVTDAELKQIVAATSVKQGAWYKCPNGHPYAIADCGGAVQTANCADCGALIGGANHQLLRDNQHYSLDGSRHAAWSEAANMENYELL